MSGQLDQEPKVLVIFTELKDGFHKLSSQPPAKQNIGLKALTEKMQEAKM